MKKSNIIGGIVLAGLLAGCTSTRIDTWSDPAFDGRPVGRVMVIGLLDDASVARQYEDHFVEQLRDEGCLADPSYEHMSPTNAITEEALVDLLDKEEFESVIVTRVVSEQDHTQFVPTGSLPEYYDSYYGYYSHGLESSGYVDQFQEYVLETSLYDVESRKLVWTGQQSVYDIKSDESNIEDAVHAVIKDLAHMRCL